MNAPKKGQYQGQYYYVGRLWWGSGLPDQDGTQAGARRRVSEPELDRLHKLSRHREAEFKWKYRIELRKVLAMHDKRPNALVEVRLKKGFTFTPFVRGVHVRSFMSIEYMIRDLRAVERCGCYRCTSP